MTLPQSKICSDILQLLFGKEHSEVFENVEQVFFPNTLIHNLTVLAVCMPDLHLPIKQPIDEQFGLLLDRILMLLEYLVDLGFQHLFGLVGQARL